MHYRKLAIFTDCIHYNNEKGEVVTQNPAFCKQMQALASLFEFTIIYCPFDIFRPGLAVSKYSQKDISFYPLQKVGGKGLIDKLNILLTFPSWFRAFRHAHKHVDIVYQRFPNNLNLPGLFYFILFRKPVFGTYTGTWENYSGEPVTFRFQKWLLKLYFRGPVGIYSRKPIQKERLFQNFSPSYTDLEWISEKSMIEKKVEKLVTNDSFIPVFLTVGALVKSKNQQMILDAFLVLYKQGIKFELYVAGEGILRNQYQNFINLNGLSHCVFLTGQIDADEMKCLYRKAHFLIQASLVEGYGKAPTEAFFYGAIPILNNVSMASRITGNEKRGYLYNAKKSEDIIEIVQFVLKDRSKYSEKIYEGRSFAKEHTIEKWITLHLSRIHSI